MKKLSNLGFILLLSVNFLQIQETHVYVGSKCMWGAPERKAEAIITCVCMTFLSPN